MPRIPDPRKRMRAAKVAAVVAVILAELNYSCSLVYLFAGEQLLAVLHTVATILCIESARINMKTHRIWKNLL